jgi:hypothetical protein
LFMLKKSPLWSKRTKREAFLHPRYILEIDNSLKKLFYQPLIILEGT